MIIDIRLRPPFKGFRQQFNADACAAFSAKLGMPSAESIRQKSMELMFEEMDRAGVTMGIAPGRHGHRFYTVPNEDVAELAENYPDRFKGLMGIDTAHLDTAIDDIKRFVLEGPLIGVNIEPGGSDRPIFGNDPRLYPIYAFCEKHQIPVMLMVGGRAGPTTDYSNPAIVSQVAADFSGMNILVSHGGWPWVTQILCTCFWQPNIYLSPDLYLINAPGAQDFIAAANHFMQDRFMFGSAYPLMPIEESVDHFKRLFKPEFLDKLMWKNAAKFFKLDMPLDE